MAMSGKRYQRTRNLFDPQAKTPFKLSRSRLEAFINCPRCFYLDRRLGIEPPGMPAFTLNSAVDALLKKEFDSYRIRKKPHPLMEEYKINAIPFSHPMIDEWRETFKGLQYHHRATNLIITGAIDDLWVTPSGELFVVDYKSTSSNEPITLDGPYKQAYKRQMEIYQWLLKKLEFKVSPMGYFVYCNADKSKGFFDGKLEFSVEIISYEGDCAWVEETVRGAHACLMSDQMPASPETCEYCHYRGAVSSKETAPAITIPTLPIVKNKKAALKTPLMQGELFDKSF